MADLRLRAYSIAAAVLALDRLTKWLVEQRVSFADTYHIIPGFFDIIRSQNRGVAFGMFNDSTFEWRTAALALVTAAAIIVVSAVIWKSRRLDATSFWGLSLILGGAAGNEFDRLVSGQVTDFLDFYLGSYHWPTFNVADSALVIGCGLFLLEMLRGKRQAANVS
jgi:signal peptidase II